MKLSDIKKGYAALNAGVWVPKIPLPFFDGVRLKVRRLWNPEYSALHEKLSDGKDSPLSAADERTITDECLLQTCLVGWDGVDDVFSVDTARGMIADPEAGAVFRSAIIWAATNATENVAANLEADAKNSPAP